MLTVRWSACAIALVALAAGAGCGGDDDSASPKPGQSDPAVTRALENAKNPRASDFPSAEGRTLQQVADSVRAGQAGLATSEFSPGPNRLAFGVIGRDNRFVYGRSAVYVAPSPNRPAEGPFLAPADPLVVKPAFRSKGAALETNSIAAIYEAEVPLTKPGSYAVLVVTKTRDGLVGGGSRIQVRRSSPVPQIGDEVPRVETDTLASAGGDVEAIDTRQPPDEMHDESLADVIGKKPVVLLMATPALCQTRVCGPVTDIAAQMQAEYGDRAVFIHQEVYEDNKVEKGLRKPLRQFGLRTEPWLFTMDADGRVAGRLEGSFGARAFENAVGAALK